MDEKIEIFEQTRERKADDSSKTLTRLAGEWPPEPPSEASLLSRTLSHYRILEALGAGGMGEVYVAEDCKLRKDAQACRRDASTARAKR